MGAIVLPGLLLAAMVALALVPPIHQDPDYHRFGDRRTLLGIPNALDVLSNLAFLAVGGLGLVRLRARDRPGAPGRGPRLALATMYLGVVATGLGSGWYHLDPGDASLVWDRLPMTVAFTGLFCFVAGERYPSISGPVFPGGCVALGVGSVIYWSATGDLRPYVLVQFFPMVAIPVLVLLVEAPHDRSLDLLVASGWYGLAKVSETLDSTIYGIGEVVSGHTIKHLLAATAIAWIVRMVHRRRPRPLSAGG